ncbi:hypothetical protein SAMN03159297_02206 [Pseudomonas sp. NFACC45]|nr:hypothetical protein SAMN03159297_02206 [Pseudomonas sp. NFACC45]
MRMLKAGFGQCWMLKFVVRQQALPQYQEQPRNPVGASLLAMRWVRQH